MREETKNVPVGMRDMVVGSSYLPSSMRSHNR